MPNEHDYRIPVSTKTLIHMYNPMSIEYGEIPYLYTPSLFATPPERSSQVRCLANLSASQIRPNDSRISMELLGLRLRVVNGDCGSSYTASCCFIPQPALALPLSLSLSLPPSPCSSSSQPGTMDQPRAGRRRARRRAAAAAGGGGGGGGGGDVRARLAGT